MFFWGHNRGKYQACVMLSNCRDSGASQAEVGLENGQKGQFQDITNKKERFLIIYIEMLILYSIKFAFHSNFAI